MGSKTSVETQVQKLAQTAKKANIHGIVCSAHEIKKVRKVSKNFENLINISNLFISKIYLFHFLDLQNYYFL